MSKEISRKAGAVKSIRSRRMATGRCVYCSRPNPRAPKYASCGCVSRSVRIKPELHPAPAGKAPQTSSRLPSKEEAFRAFIAAIGDTDAMRTAADCFIRAKS